MTQGLAIQRTAASERKSAETIKQTYLRHREIVLKELEPQYIRTAATIQIRINQGADVDQAVKEHLQSAPSFFRALEIYKQFSALVSGDPYKFLEDK